MIVIGMEKGKGVKMHTRTIVIGTIAFIVMLNGASVMNAGAAVDPYTETFASDNANWGGGGDWTTFQPLDWSGSGGPDGGGFVSDTLNFSEFSPGGFPLTVFRGQDNYNSSNGAFEGDWLAGGITTFSFWVRHNAPIDLQYFVRFTPADANSPSMNFEFSDSLVAPNTWTQLTLDISEDNPGWIVGGGPGTYNSVFTNLGKIQLGADMGGLAGMEPDFTFDLANVAIIPAPGAISLLALAGLFGTRRRR